MIRALILLALAAPAAALTTAQVDAYLDASIAYTQRQGQTPAPRESQRAEATCVLQRLEAAGGTAAVEGVIDFTRQLANGAQPQDPSVRPFLQAHGLAYVEAAEACTNTQIIQR